MSSNLPAQREFDDKEIALIRSTVAPRATAEEFKLFLYRCRHMGLDPLKPGEIFFIKYGDSPGTIVVGIEGFRKRAERTGKRAGIKRGVLKDDEGRCVGAWCEVFRSDWKEPAREEVPLSEYFKPGKNGKKSNWELMPETMIKKVAEAAALRMAFPDELGGLYVREEMDQAEARDVNPPPSQNEPISHEDALADEYARPPQSPPWDDEEFTRDPRTVPMVGKKFAKHKTVGEAWDKDCIPLQQYVAWLIEQNGGNPKKPETFDEAISQMNPDYSMFCIAVLKLVNEAKAKRAAEDARPLTEEEEMEVERMTNEMRMGRHTQYTPQDAMKDRKRG